MTDKAPENRVYIIVDSKTKKQVGKEYTARKPADRRANKLDLAYGAVRYVVKPKILAETAAGGGTGGGAIAAAPFRMGGTQTRSIKDYMADFYTKVKNRGNFSLVKLKEADDLSSIISKLKGMENNIRGDHDDTVTYGVEDDEGNIMKVTVKKDQAKDFEHRLGVELAEIEEYKMSGFSKEGLSMAELLYNLKQNFNIVDVEFPKIPEDVIYNADKASTGPDSNDLVGNDDIDADANMEDGFDGEGDLGGDATMGGELGAPNGGELGGEGDLGGLDAAGGEEGDELGDLDNELNMDDESVEDFEEDADGEVSAESLLKSLLGTMKADAEAKKAEAEAQAEMARAKQAEYSYKASQAAVAQQEELLQMETELEAQKEKEKESKKLADLAKYRVNKAKSISTLPESFSSILGQIIMELDEFDTESNIRKERANLGTQYRILPTDSKEATQYKRQMMQQAAQQLNARLRAVRIRDQYNRSVATKQPVDPTQPTQNAAPNQSQSSDQRM